MIRLKAFNADDIVILSFQHEAPNSTSAAKP
jgi:hypothetical protein